MDVDRTHDALWGARQRHMSYCRDDFFYFVKAQCAAPIVYMEEQELHVKEVQPRYHNRSSR